MRFFTRFVALWTFGNRCLLLSSGKSVSTSKQMVSKHRFFHNCSFWLNFCDEWKWNPNEIQLKITKSFNKPTTFLEFSTQKRVFFLFCTEWNNSESVDWPRYWYYFTQKKKEDFFLWWNMRGSTTGTLSYVAPQTPTNYCISEWEIEVHICSLSLCFICRWVQNIL